jgi:ABC-type antimicrobial peptide transport system permease subunit
VLWGGTAGDAQRLLAEMRRVLLELEPNLVFLDNQTMETQVGATLLPIRAGALLGSTLGAVALALAAFGLYGVVAYSVSRRTREIGVRMALGADRARMVSLVLRQGLGLAAIGLVAGAALAAPLSRALGGLLYGVSVSDPLAWGAAVAILLLATAAANTVPALRASRVNPSVALRAD